MKNAQVDWYNSQYNSINFIPYTPDKTIQERVKEKEATSNEKD